MTKAIIFDASTLISLSMNGLLDELKDLKSIFKGHFIITANVRKEVIDKPIEKKRFELEAVRIEQLVRDKVLEYPEVFGVSEQEINSRTTELVNIANSLFYGNGKNIHILDEGEVSCLTLSKILTYKKISNVIAVDERTLRVIGEKPQNLKKILQKKLHTSIRINKNNFQMFEGFRFIRSAELMYVAWKKGLIDVKSPKTLDALLWAVKFKGCSITDEEIREIEGLK